MVNRGEVWWATVDGMRRPHLVLTRPQAVPLLNAVLCVPATRTMRGIPSEVELDADDGMPAACVLSLDNLVKVRKGAFDERICVLGPERMRDVCRALAFATGC